MFKAIKWWYDVDKGAIFVQAESKEGYQYKDFEFVRDQFFDADFPEALGELSKKAYMFMRLMIEQKIDPKATVKGGKK